MRFSFPFFVIPKKPLFDIIFFYFDFAEQTEKRKRLPDCEILHNFRLGRVYCRSRSNKWRFWSVIETAGLFFLIISRFESFLLDLNKDLRFWNLNNEKLINTSVTSSFDFFEQRSSVTFCKFHYNENLISDTLLTLL